MTHMDRLDRAKNNLVIANRILAREGIFDAFGHVSIRHPLDPGRFLQSCSRSPELVTPSDIMELTFDGKPVGGDDRPTYLERFIHGAVYSARPGIRAVVHSHAESILPFTVTETAFVPVIHTASVLGMTIPLWDIRDRFGTKTNMMVTNETQARDLVQTLGRNNIVLMRGHGFTAVSDYLVQALRISIYAPSNARVLAEARRLGTVRALTQDEIDINAAIDPESPAVMRVWEYWARRAGCADLLEPRRSVTVSRTASARKERRRGAKRRRAR
jgi:HCOMODA/2-hydroxy-3-carboxy-muconic semialdehyde decarboxylase